MDPLAVADGGLFEYAFRLAAFNYQTEIERKQAEKQKAEQTAKRH